MSEARVTFHAFIVCKDTHVEQGFDLRLTVSHTGLLAKGNMVSLGAALGRKVIESVRYNIPYGEIDVYLDEHRIGEAQYEQICTAMREGGWTQCI